MGRKIRRLHVITVICIPVVTTGHGKENRGIIIYISVNFAGIRISFVKNVITQLPQRCKQLLHDEI